MLPQQCNMCRLYLYGFFVSYQLSVYRQQVIDYNHYMIDTKHPNMGLLSDT